MASNWHRIKLGKCVKIYSGVSPSALSLRESGRYPFVKVEDLNNCAKYQWKSRYYTNTKKGIAPANSVIFPKRGAAILNNKIRIASVDLAIDTNLMAVMPHGNLDSEFFFYAIERESLFRIADTSTIPQLNNKHINPYTLRLPPLPEQIRIVEILRTWDEAIDKLQALAIAQRKKHSQATNALLFSKESGRRKKTGKRLQQLADVTRELTQRNNGLNLGREFVMGVSNSKGIVPMREQSIGGDLARYKVLPPRAFAYNPMRINVGSIAMSRLDSCVLVSPDYVLFECVDDRLDPDYLDHLCNTHWWSHHINAGGSGSVRMRTYYDDLAALRLELPDFEEQKKISSYLNAARRENDLIADQINALERQKRGLMQKLLTGEWRVKGSEKKESDQWPTI